MFKRKTVKINAPKVIKVKPKNFKDMTLNFKQSIKDTGDHKVGDRILLKEHDGRKYTAREIMAYITAIEKGRVYFKKIAIVKDEGRAKQNGSDSRRHYNFDKYN